MLTKKSKYGLKALLHLARVYGQSPVRIADLSKAEGIPPKFLELILWELKTRGLLQSKKGRGGGYSLAVPPDRVSIGSVLRLLDGPLALLPCVSRTAYGPCEECADERTCGIRMVMQEVRDRTAGVLDGTSLAGLNERVDKTTGSGTPLVYSI